MVLLNTFYVCECVCMRVRVRVRVCGYVELYKIVTYLYSHYCHTNMIVLT